MHIIDRHNLASAYMTIWHLAKNPINSDLRIVVNPLPNGWFETIKTMGSVQTITKVRAGTLIQNLALMSEKIAQKQ
tara:strand:- start:657 stop:884 length:228 start_codon:yes stop_codon:yes gene_type:complete